MDDPHEEDVSLTFDELEEQKFLCKSCFRGDNFSTKISLPTSGPQRVSRLRYMPRTTTHVDYDQANKYTYSSSVSFSGSKALYLQTFENLFRARRRLHWGKRSLKTSICAIMIILRLFYLTRIQQCWTGKSKVNKDWGGFHDFVAYCMREVCTGKP